MDRRRLQRRRCAEIKRRHRYLNFLRHQMRIRTLLCLSVNILLMSNALVERNIWSRERSQEWWFRTRGWTNQDYYNNLRMSRDTFVHICHILSPYINCRNTHLRRSIDVERRVAITIWRLATNIEYRTLSHLFGIGRSTACTIVQKTCQAIVQYLMPHFIKIPAGEAFNDNVNGFFDMGMPQCIGAIDGTHIPIIAPIENHADYFNRKGFHSIILQAVVDHAYQFMDIYVGWPGSVHDARVFANSPIARKLSTATAFDNRMENINGTQVPYYIIGDPAYPILPVLMKAFANTDQLTDDQRKFNITLSGARVVVENAFGRLKGRWRSLMKRNDAELDNVITEVAACCTLHNICERSGDAFNNDWIQPDDQVPNCQPLPINNPHHSTDIRNALVQWVSTH
ncbi:uncharacterized protein LOC123539178 [Mercenaria mercenaria]|uniref:uncharacterized protein LOC123539178 n=1 Tax=Mercenaria mercenaria TaxID=6596 RepID=UPI00234E6CAC|nr:uncharacterized protein LOC123539178 [Mercenaria mercenaria]